MLIFNFKIIVLIVGLMLSLGTLLMIFSGKSKILKIISEIILLGAIILQVLFIIYIWISLHRPPLKTIGETRIIEAFFISVIGYISYKRYKYVLLLGLIILMSLIFVILNYFHPENYDKSLAPALQSAWFAPHVIAYMLGYAFLLCSALIAAIGLFAHFLKNNTIEWLPIADTLVIPGYAFVTLGLVFGALWAKEAWGHYWTWDPKETWAFITWAGYLIYMHARYYRPQKRIAALWILTFAFVILLIAWFGLNYLPSAQNSVHIYSSYQ